MSPKIIIQWDKRFHEVASTFLIGPPMISLQNFDIVKKFKQKRIKMHIHNDFGTILQPNVPEVHTYLSNGLKKSQFEIVNHYIHYRFQIDCEFESNQYSQLHETTIMSSKQSIIFTCFVLSQIFNTYYAHQCQFGCGNLKMVDPKKQDFCKEVTRFQEFHLIF